MNSIGRKIVFIIMATALTTLAQGEARAPQSRWMIGDRWVVECVLYDRGWALSLSNPSSNEEGISERVLAEYAVLVEVTARIPLEGLDCWQLDFTPDENAPAGVREQKYRILVSTTTGLIKSIFRLKGEERGSAVVEDVSGIPILENAPYGFPLETIPWDTDRPIKNVAEPTPNKRLLSVERKETRVNGAIELALELKAGPKTLSSVSQKWDQGNRWWSEYEKYNRGHKELQAKLKVSEPEK